MGNCFLGLYSLTTSDIPALEAATTCLHVTLQAKILPMESHWLRIYLWPTISYIALYPWYSFLCIWVCALWMCTCSHMWMRLHACPCTWVEVRKQPWHQYTPLPLFETLSLALQLHTGGNPPSLPLPLPTVGTQMCVTMANVVRIQIQILTLAQTLYQLSYLPSPTDL